MIYWIALRPIALREVTRYSTIVLWYCNLIYVSSLLYSLVLVNSLLGLDDWYNSYIVLERGLFGHNLSIDNIATMRSDGTHLQVIFTRIEVFYIMRVSKCKLLHFQWSILLFRFTIFLLVLSFLSFCDTTFLKRILLSLSSHATCFLRCR